MVTIPRNIYDAMVEHVCADYPDEACGVLAGIGNSAVHHFPARNAADEPATFSIIDGPDLLAIWNEIDQQDWNVLAYYHSHPRTQAYPSPRDIQYAQGWPGTFYVIFTLIDPDHPKVRAFQIDGGNVTEHQIIITE